MLESLHFQVPPSFSLSVGVSTQGNFLPLLVECDFDLGMTTLLILMSQLQCLQWLLNALSWQDAVRLHRVLLE